MKKYTIIESTKHFNFCQRQNINPYQLEKMKYREKGECDKKSQCQFDYKRRKVDNS